MYNKNQNSRSLLVIARQDIGALLKSLIKSGYQTLGPVIDNQAIVYGEISSIDDLPIGWSDRQDGGHYRLVESNRPALFDYVVGQHSWKKFIHVPVREVAISERSGKHFDTTQCDEAPVKRAFFGVRSCELHALEIQDKILLEGPYADNGYRALRKNLFIVAVNCTNPGGTCFCSSMKTGPKAAGGFDLALTEVFEDNKHYFVVEIGSADGEKLLKNVPHHNASDKEINAAEAALEKSAANMGRRVKTDDLKELLERNFDNLHWDKVAERCLTCGNCTMVCPTCFCSNVEDETSLAGDRAIRRRMWDSCFTIGFSHIHGGSIRNTEMSRYRQWMMHKLCYWVDQFDSFGCVGCGRCITWCPVGIDITKEVEAIRESEK